MLVWAKLPQTKLRGSTASHCITLSQRAEPKDQRQLALSAEQPSHQVSRTGPTQMENVLVFVSKPFRRRPNGRKHTGSTIRPRGSKGRLRKLFSKVMVGTYSVQGLSGRLGRGSVRKWGLPCKSGDLSLSPRTQVKVEKDNGQASQQEVFRSYWDTSSPLLFTVLIQESNGSFY